MDRVDHSIPYQALDASSDTSRTTVQGNVRRAASNGNISTVSGSSDSFRTLSSSRGQSPVALLVDGMEQEQSRPLDLFAGSPSGGSKGTSTGGRGGRKRTVSFWVSLCTIVRYCRCQRCIRSTCLLVRAGIYVCAYTNASSNFFGT